MLIAPIQYLRAVAALMVVWSHAAEQVPGVQSSFTYHLGDLGVGIFFVVSGFVMTLTPAGTTPLQFMWRRIIRVVPLYWAMTLLVTAAALVAPSLFRGTAAEPWHVIASMLFIPHENPARGGEWLPILVPGWTLNYEMFFYAVFAISLAAGRWVVPAVLGGLLLLGLTSPSDHLVQFFTHARMAGFLLGALMGWYAPRHPGRIAAWASAVVGLALMGFADNEFASVAGCALFVWASLALTVRSRLLAALGDASYSIYLTHPFAMGALRVVWSKLGADPTLFIPVAMVISALVGWLVYGLAEQPIQLKMRRRRLAASATS